MKKKMEILKKENKEKLESFFEDNKKNRFRLKKGGKKKGVDLL